MGFLRRIVSLFSVGTGRNLRPAEKMGTVPTEISNEEAVRLLADGSAPVLLDVRETLELESSGWIPGSTHIPMSEIEARFEELAPAAPLLIYCAGGVRSYNVGCFLIAQGFENVSNLSGGFHGWRGEIARSN